MGTETFFREDGSKKWEKTYAGDDGWTWRNFDFAARETSQSKWKGKTLVSYRIAGDLTSAGD
ncbi:MAG: hypothetical protein ACRD25_07995 [Terracidiphilus sp.]